MSKGSNSRVTDRKAYDKRYLPKAKRCAGCGMIIKLHEQGFDTCQMCRIPVMVKRILR